MIERTKYLNQLINTKNNGFPKVITGIRRCGKSYLLFEIFKKHLLDNSVPTEQIIEVLLDDKEFEELHNKKKLNEYIKYQEKKI